jgi:hypothetical protein
LLAKGFSQTFDKNTHAKGAGKSMRDLGWNALKELFDQEGNGKEEKSDLLLIEHDKE